MTTPLSDEFLTTVYDALNDSPMQRKFKKIRPMPYGVVFLPWAGMSEKEMRGHFQMMRELGFTNLKQTMPTPEWSTERILTIALEEGIIPFWYGEGGWEDIDDDLLNRLGIPLETPIEVIRTDARMLAYQHDVLARRIGYEPLKLKVEGGVLQDTGAEKWDATEVQLHNDPVLRDEAIPAFKSWVKDRYSTIESLNTTWNLGEVGICPRPYESWDDFDSDEKLRRFSRHGEYRHIRDILRFKADHTLVRVQRAVELACERDPQEPQRAGGEMGLFLPFAWRGTDMQGFARIMRKHGSFYPSLHLAWHFEEVDYEVTRCIYMQASIAVDWFKGGWAATWESTGGPQQFSGGKAWNPLAAAQTAGFTVDAGTMSQLLLSYIAAGFKGVGLWSWNYRRAGWEAGEYALLNRQNLPGPRAIRAGQIAQAANRLRDELWQARKEPSVGVFVDWDNEAIWAAISMPNRDKFRFLPVHARIGVSRALINGNIPWEHVTADDLRGGLAARYRIIYLPAQIALNEEILSMLRSYVQGGGRLVMDAPGGWFDSRGHVLDVGVGSLFEQIFGVEIRDFQYSNNVPRSLACLSLEGFILDLAPTTASALDHYDNGEIAVTENRLGHGSAVVIGFEASHLAFKPGNVEIESHLLRYAMGPHESPYSCEGTVVYRLAAPDADHYFFLNDGPAKSVRLDSKRHHYISVSDPVSGKILALNSEFDVEGYGARWLRFEK